MGSDRLDRASARCRVRLGDERGSTIVFMCLLLTVLLGMAALVIDAGLLYTERIHMQNAADAAALAGVLELPEYPGAAQTTAQSYAVSNGVEPDDFGCTVTADNRKIGVTVQKMVQLPLARILGVDEALVMAYAYARVGVARSAVGVVPFGIVKQDFQYGVTYTLKLGAGDPGQHHGNFGALALCSPGACVYRLNIKNGYQGELHVGDWVETEPGNMSGPTVDGVTYRLNGCTHVPRCTCDSFVQGCPRLVLVPVIDSLEVYGRDDVLIVGFAAFFLEDYVGHGNDCYVYGKFVRYATSAELGDTQDYGLRSYKLDRS